MNHDTLATQIRSLFAGLTGEQAAELTYALEQLIGALGPERIYVFGSHARGDATVASDVDLFVVVPDSDTPAHHRARRAYEAVGPHRLPLDILVMPRTEFEKRSAAVSSLPATVLREGHLLYAA